LKSISVGSPDTKSPYSVQHILICCKGWFMRGHSPLQMDIQKPIHFVLILEQMTSCIGYSLSRLNLPLMIMTLMDFLFYCKVPLFSLILNMHSFFPHLYGYSCFSDWIYTAMKMYSSWCVSINKHNRVSLRKNNDHPTAQSV